MYDNQFKCEHNIVRREFLKRCAAGTAGAAAAASGCSGAGTSGRKPNIIFILADDLGYGDVGCYGQKTIRTPNIDRLAGDGMLFTDHYAGSTVCAPSRCCLMTGLHTGHAYIRGNRQASPQGQEPIPAGTLTVAELLRNAGYTTALIGKWGLGGPGTEGHPNRQGFDYFFGYLCQGHAHNYYPEFLYRNNDKVPLEGNEVDGSERYEGAGVAHRKARYSHDLMVEEALSFIDRTKDGQFFLYLALTIPHANNEAGKEGMEVPTDAPYTTRDWPQQQKNHAAMITRMDTDIGTLMAKLKELGIDKDTIVMFSSDNGPHREGGADPDFFDSNGPLRGIKRDLYEGGIRVPLIVRWPGYIRSGTVTEHVSAFWDFMPTAADIAGTGTPDGIDGISYLPTLIGGEQRKHEFLYWEFHEGAGSKQAVRMGTWKAVKNRPSLPMELYDLTTDIGEERNVADSHPGALNRIEEYLKTARTESEYWNIFER